MNERELKEIYTLWIEYLKRSRQYISVCEHVDRNNSFLPLDSFPDELKDIKTLVTNYMIFGDIHKQTLEETLFKIDMWKEVFSSLSSPVEDYSKRVEEDMNRLIRTFKNRHGREPNLDEFISDFLNFMRDCSFAYLRLNLSGAKTDALKKGVALFLKERKKYIKKIPSLLPSTGIRVEELTRYLKIYDHRENGRAWKAIMEDEAFGQKGDDILRGLKRDVHKAKKIIRNVEKGVFPGNY